MKKICSNCLKNEGLKIEALKIAWRKCEICELCGKTGGVEIDELNINEIMLNFYVHGSTILSVGGMAPVLQFNSYDHINPLTEKSILADTELLKKIFGLSVFLYAPQTWRFGETNYYSCLMDEKEIEENVKKIIDCFQNKIIYSSINIYRVRANINGNPCDIKEYDTPTSELKNGKYFRFDAPETEIFYSCFDIETCIHEAKCSIDDEFYLATLNLTKELKIIDMTDCVKTDIVTMFDSPIPTIHYMISTQNSDSQNYCRRISKRIKMMGYDGFIYPSFYNKVKESKALNLALFGFPIKENKLTMKSLNRIRINDTCYKYGLGPILEYH